MKQSDFQMLFLLLVFILGFLLNRNLSKINEKILDFTPYLRSYWVLSVLILVISLMLNILNLNYDPFKDKQIISDWINTYALLIFAILTGYQAFKQIQDGRFDKLSQDAITNFRAGESRFNEARDLYKDALAIKPKDINILRNFGELAMILGDDVLFEQIIKKMKKVAKDTKEIIILHYLEIGKELLSEDIRSAKREIKNLIKFLKDNPNSLDGLGWSFGELQSSSSYKALSGDPKTILTSLIDLLSKKLNDEAKLEFMDKYQ